MRSAWFQKAVVVLLSVAVGLAGCLAPPKIPPPPPRCTTRFPATTGMFNLLVIEQPKAQAAKCFGPNPPDLGIVGKVAFGVFRLVAVCPMIPVMPPFGALFSVALLPITIPVDIAIASSCPEIGVPQATPTEQPSVVVPDRP
jgi:hypothetical protein